MPTARISLELELASVKDQADAETWMRAFLHQLKEWRLLTVIKSGVKVK